MAGTTIITNWLGYGAVSAIPVAATLDALLSSGSIAFYYAKDTNTLYVLDRDTPAWEIVASGGGGVATLEELSDVGVDTGLATNDFFVFNGTQWVNITAAQAGALIGATGPSGAANTPLFDNGAGGFTNGTRSGNTTEVATWSGSKTSGHLVVLDASGNIVDGGAVPSAGASYFDDLLDVSIDTGLAADDIFVFNGTVITNTSKTAFLSATLTQAKTEYIQVAVSDETTAITTGTAKITFRMPFAMTLTEVRASLSTASSSGNPAIDVNEGGASIFSTTLTIDSGEKTSTTAATPAVISDSALADDAEITIDIDTAGTGAKGLKVTLIGTRA